MQLVTVLSVWLLGEVIAKLIPIGIPGNVIAMILMLVFLLTKVIRIEKISQVSTFFLDNISFFFIPASVALMVDYKIIGSSLVPAVIAILISSILVFLITGYTTEFLLWIIRKRKERKNAER